MKTEPREKISFKGYSYFLENTEHGSNITLPVMQRAALVGYYDASVGELDKMDAADVQAKFQAVYERMTAEVQELGEALGKSTASSE